MAQTVREDNTLMAEHWEGDPVITMTAAGTLPAPEAAAAVVDRTNAIQKTTQVAVAVAAVTVAAAAVVAAAAMTTRGPEPRVMAVRAAPSVW
jgi:hypothetical protein